jgi:hypothetical protein
MVAILLHCPSRQSVAPVCSDHAPHCKNLYCCRSYGPQGRENTTPSASSYACHNEILYIFEEHIPQIQKEEHERRAN